MVAAQNVFKYLFGLRSGGGHQRVVVIERNQGRGDDVFGKWVRGADK